jgi:hypothetical protein
MAQRDGVEGLGIAAELEELRRLEPPAQDPAHREAIMRSVLELSTAHAEARAFRVAAPRRRFAAALHSRRIPRYALPLAAAAAIGIAWLVAPRDDGDAASAPVAAPSPRLVLRSGALAANDVPVRSGAAIAADTAIETSAEPAELVLRDASVLSAARDTALVYTANGEDRFRLEHGEVSLRVQPRTAAAPLVVETEELSAWVVGTRFAVSRSRRDSHYETTVVVAEGLVRVVSKADAETQLLGAGARLTLRAANVPEPGAQLEPGASSAQREPEDAPSKLAPALRGGASSTGSAPALRGGASFSTVIRQKLKAGEIGTARRLIQRAQRDRAASDVELAMLEAEADLAERRPERAKGRYLAIVSRYPQTSEAELSLFAAAQLSRGKAGIDLLQRYLARYPDGRFAKEAARLLDALDTRTGPD